MIPLLGRELRALSPWTILVLVIVVGGYVLTVLATPPDQIVWAVSSPILSGGAAGGRSIILVLSALVFAYSGLAREYDERTLEFLLSLPVSRWSILAAKWLAGVLMLSVPIVADELVRWLIQIPNSASLDGRTFRVDWALLSVGVGVALGAVLLGHSLFLSIFRRFGLLLGLLAVVAVEWASKQSPALRRLSPFALQPLEFDGTRALVPWTAFAAHLVVSLALTALAGVVWLGPAERWTNALARWTQRAWGKWAIAAAGVTLVGVLAWYTVERSERELDGFATVDGLDSEQRTLHTSRYEFRYPAAFQQPMGRLSREADALHARIAAKLGAPSGGAKTVVNLLLSSPTHAGSATWDTIRLDLTRASDDRVLLRTLVHETTHVLALRASDRRTATHSTAFRFFDEGLAEQVALELVPDVASGEARALEAVLARSRLSVDFSDLIDFPRFAERFGEGAVYGPAYIWVQALAEACGEGAPRRVLQALTAPDVPREAGAAALWRHVLQSLRCDLSRVNAIWGERLDRHSAEYRAELARVPNLVGGAPSSVDGDLVLTAALEGEPLEGAAYTTLVRHRTAGPMGDGHSPVSPYSGVLRPDNTVRFWLDDAYAPGEAIEFQFAITWLRHGVTVQHTGEWQKALR